MSNIRIEPKKIPWGVIVPLTLVAVGVTAWMMWPSDNQQRMLASYKENAPASQAEATTASNEPPITSGADANIGTANPMGGERSMGTLFDLDAQGKLVINSKTKDALVTILEPFPNGPTPKDWDTLEDKLSKDLSKDALQQAMQLLRNMNQLNLAVESLKKANPNAEAEGKTMELFAQLKSLRRQNFDSRTAEALFAEEEKWADFLLQAQSIDASGKLSDEARTAKLKELIATLPEDMRGKAAQALLPSE